MLTKRFPGIYTPLFPYTGVVFFCILWAACSSPKEVPAMKHTNALAEETSPYLLQHAYNPVNWMPWGDEAFAKAEAENKLVIISIGYSSCHWCHVMERETFEDSAAAALMNEHYVAVKVDREERPDVDQVYMTAVQLMTQSGGWPLNVVALPDGRPVWGGTYFPKANWMQALQSIYEVYHDEPDKVLEYAEKLHQGIIQSELIPANPAPPDFSPEETQAMVLNWQNQFDTVHGGTEGAPKFPLPNNQRFLLHYGHLEKDQATLDHVCLTLQRMAYGGIYDQVGGGFARYSTDGLWKAPHFEKMLYDNAQLVSLYSEAFRKFKNPLYARIVRETLAWIEAEMTGKEGAFYSALDADSEGEEGKFYIWTREELQKLIPADQWDDFAATYQVNSNGLWENGHYILLRDPGADPAQSEPPHPSIETWKKLLKKHRDQRVRPGLDDKALTSWNALMLKGYLQAYKAFCVTDPALARTYRQRAERNAKWILDHQLRKDGSLYHSYRQGESSIDGLLEDYAFAIAAFLQLFEVSFEESYLQQAEQWVQYARNHFQDTATGLFYTRSLKADPLIAKSMETGDNVISSSNSVMALNLFYLSHYLDEPDYRLQAERMLNQVKDRALQYGGGYSNWGRLMTHLTYPFYEVAISGPEARSQYEILQQDYHPNTLWIAAEKDSDLPLLAQRYTPGKTLIYVCQNKVCQLPVEQPQQALSLLR